MDKGIDTYISAWAEEVREALRDRDQSAWTVADLVLEGLDEFGAVVGQVELLKNLADALDVAVKTLMNYARVAQEWPVDQRVDGLSFGHHEALVSVRDGLQRAEWVVLTLEQRWSVSKLRYELRRTRSDSQPTEDETVRAWLADLHVHLYRSSKRIELVLPSGKAVVMQSDSPIEIREARND